MPFRHSHGLRYFTFDSLDRQKLKHGVFTRQGGVSPEPWSSLNQGGTVGDERVHVVENRRRLFAAMDLPVESIYDAWQVHGTHAICTKHPRPLDAPHEKADIILTDRPEVALFMRFADCVPIVLYDPAHRVVGLVHAGWRGTVDKAAAVAVGQMVETYGCNPAEVMACVGPSICVEHYEVGKEVQTAASESFGNQTSSLLIRRGKGVHFDLWKANRLTLEECGVKQIEMAGLCTVCQNQDWYSHRAEQGRTGRFGALITLS